MTCPCHDPHVFGHLHCHRWETQPRARQPLTQPPWGTSQYQTLTQHVQALHEHLRHASMSFQTLEQEPGTPEVH